MAETVKQFLINFWSFFVQISFFGVNQDIRGHRRFLNMHKMVNCSLLHGSAVRGRSRGVRPVDAVQKRNPQCSASRVGSGADLRQYCVRKEAVCSPWAVHRLEAYVCNVAFPERGAMFRRYLPGIYGPTPMLHWLYGVWSDVSNSLALDR